MKKRMKVYISGPITGLPEGKAKKAFFKAHDDLKKKGYRPMLPAGMCANEYDLEHEEFMELDFALLRICDAIYLLKGWESSGGAKRELVFAASHRKRIMYEERNEENGMVEGGGDHLCSGGSLRSAGDDDHDCLLDGEEGRSGTAAPERTREGITRQEAADLELIGAEIEVKDCNRCAESKDGRVCDYGDYYGKMVMEDGHCRGFKEKTTEMCWFEEDCNDIICSECGAIILDDDIYNYIKSGNLNYCPNCGMRVE